MKLIFATNNQHKVDEIKQVITTEFELITLAEAGVEIEIPEPFDTLEKNASHKSSVIHKLTEVNCFSEDTGLEVRALNGEPGVRSARYAGEGRSPEDNIDKLLMKLENLSDRSAQFRTIISLILNGREWMFEGICPGRITHSRAGRAGFGYDPVFVPDGAEITFAEMDSKTKNSFSHRAIATQKLVAFLNNHQ